jgi:chitinase
MYLHLHLALGFLAFLFPFVFSAPTCGLAPPKETNTSSSSSTTGCNTLAATDAVLTGWYPGWLGNQFPPQNLSWSKYTALTFAFAYGFTSFRHVNAADVYIFSVTTPDGGVSLDDVSTQVLPEFVASAKQHVSLFYQFLSFSSYPL